MNPVGEIRFGIGQAKNKLLYPSLGATALSAERSAQERKINILGRTFRTTSHSLMKAKSNYLH